MSTRVVRDVFAAGYQSASHKLVMLAIADRAEHDGGNAFPTQPELAAAAMCSVRTIVRIVADLQAAGYLEVTPHGGGSAAFTADGGRRPNLYRITATGRVGRQIVVQPRKNRRTVARQNDTQPSEVGRQIGGGWTPNPSRLDATPPSATCDDATGTSSSEHPSLNSSGSTRDVVTTQPASDAAGAADVDVDLDGTIDELLTAYTAIRVATTPPKDPDRWLRSMPDTFRREQAPGWRAALLANPDCDRLQLLASSSIGWTRETVRRHLRAAGHPLSESFDETDRALDSDGHAPAHPHHSSSHGSDVEGCTCAGNRFVPCELDDHDRSVIPPGSPNLDRAAS